MVSTMEQPTNDAMASFMDESRVLSMEQPTDYATGPSMASFVDEPMVPTTE